MDVLLKVAKDALKDETIQKWETFMNEHESKFEDVAEHKLEYTEIYNQFTAMVEGDLSDIVKAHGSTVEDFFALCRESQEDANAQAFVALLVDSMDYTPFADIMKNREKRHYYFSILKMWRKSLA